jgi:hypothetical protein
LAGPNDEPETLAMRGGAVADRFAWVFMSGYQAALKKCFPEYCGNGWSCFAVAEPREGPGCELQESEDGYRLTGQKSWVAGAEHVDRLIVSLDDARRFVCLERDRTGVEISLPRAPSFLAELSQGVAVFNAVEIDRSEVLDEPARARRFRGAEPLHVLIALNAFLAGRTRALGGSDSLVDQAEAVLEAAAGLSPVLDDRAAFKAGLAELRRATRDVVVQFERELLPAAEEVLQVSWQADGRLLRMFGVAVSE